MMEKYREPQIYVVNNKEIAERLSQNYIVATGDLGVTKSVEYEEFVNKRFVKLEYSMIDNLHEYSVVIIDLQNINETKYSSVDDEPNGMGILFELDYPKNEFIPDPLVLSILKRELSSQSLKIIFAGSSYSEEYNIVKVQKQNNYIFQNKELCNIYDIILAGATSKSGKKIISENNKLAGSIAKYVEGYMAIFKLPTKMDESSQKKS